MGPTVRISDNNFDRNVPTLVFKMGRYPVHHGGLGVVRSLHRAGIPVYANHEDFFTPVARSRHLGTPMVWVVSPCDTASILQRLEAFSDSIGKPTVIIPTDDEAALFIARQRERLQDRFLVTATEPSVIESVADKLALACTIAKLRMPTVRSATPRSEEQLLEFLDAVGLPVVLKASDAALVRTSGERSTVLLRDAQQAIELFRDNGHIQRGEQFLQEFIRDGQDWFFHGYSDASSKLLVGFTGVKLRSYPRLAGPTSFGQWVHNDDL
ncbi:MAG: D-aspartate ligase, partial [Acidimicrobiia bacterium]|nr:D-aspartate ligase [Acidimicrobiia bacterium]